MKFQTSLRNILPDDDHRGIFSISIAEDTQRCIADARFGRYLDSSKQMGVKYQFVEDRTRNGSGNFTMS